MREWIKDIDPMDGEIFWLAPDDIVDAMPLKKRLEYMIARDLFSAKIASHSPGVAGMPEVFYKNRASWYLEELMELDDA
jgi:hypothetical protein